MDHENGLQNPSKVLELVVARFLCKRNDDLTWLISPKAVTFASSKGVSISNAFVLAPDDDWKAYKNLSNHEELIYKHQELFADIMKDLVEQLGTEVGRFVSHIRPDEFRILLIYAGQDVYDFFVRDHRFGAPPRGKIFRSNKRKIWGTERSTVHRPDMAVVAMKRKIRYMEAIGADVDSLKVELARREAVLAQGGDPLAGSRRTSSKSIALTPKQALDIYRSEILGLAVDPEAKFGRRWTDR